MEELCDMRREWRSYVTWGGSGGVSDMRRERRSYVTWGGSGGVM